MRDLRTDFRLLTSPFRVLPDFAIVGEAKCGTTSLYRYMLQHPGILGADRKEPRNFIQYPGSALYCRSHFPTYAVWGLRRLARFRPVVAGEATAEYFSHPAVAERIRKLVPGIRIIVLLRNPVHRALSDYQMLKRNGLVNLDFSEVVDRSLAWLGDPRLRDLVDAALESEHFYLRFVVRGVYMWSLPHWFDEFPSSQILVLKSEDLFTDSRTVMSRVHDFLSVEDREIQDLTVRKSGQYEERMDGDTLSRLREFYEPWNRQLYEYLDRDLGWEAELEGRAGAAVGAKGEEAPRQS